jgi:hypothetical protein
MRFRVFARAFLCATSYITMRIYALRTLMALGKPHFVGILSLKKGRMSRSEFPKAIASFRFALTLLAPTPPWEWGGFVASRYQCNLLR